MSKAFQDTPTPFHTSVAHAEVTADTTGAVFFVGHPTKRCRIKSVKYLNPTGLANHATNYFVLQIKQGSVVVASWSTLTGAQGAIGAGEYEELVLSSTDSDLVLEAGEKLHYVLDETGAATLPVGTFFIWGDVLPDPNS